jgi:hypothetical protein
MPNIGSPFTACAVKATTAGGVRCFFREQYTQIGIRFTCILQREPGDFEAEVTSMFSRSSMLALVRSFCGVEVV